jgi:hypothetical protein
MATGGKEMNMISQHMKRALSPIPKFMLLGFMLMNAFACSTCDARNPEMVTGLSVEVLNYSQESIASVMVGGIRVSGAIHKSKIGGAKGSGIACCSGEISAIKNTATVTVEAEHGTYTTQAEVELPFPDIMDTMMVHVLPGHKVIIEVVPGSTRPRQDLMNAQIKALGLKKEESDSYYMRSERPKYTGYYKPD